ncbi:putative RNA methyltransferase [Arthrobacter sp. 754]|uniref:putative RNA methyltransferase n=1 Tax=Arthrobacter sp. 754 TaxID=3156315 RepID=UPI0033916DA8
MPSSPPTPLRCPVCGAPLQPVDGPGAPQRALVCASGHSFDAAKQGYYNLLVGKGTVFEADSARMVASRFDFLDAGHYRPLAEAVAAAVAPLLTRRGGFTILDSGTGTGQYLRVVLDEVSRRGATCTALALDISKFALRRAARLNPEAICLACDVWQPLPIADAAVDAVTVIFAPRNAAEFARVLRPGGRLIVVTPRAGHLAAVAARTGMLGIAEDKDTRLAESLSGHFVADTVRDLDIGMMLTPGEIADLAFMGPAGHHLDRAALVSSLGTGGGATAVEARFRISVFRRATAAS